MLEGSARVDHRRLELETWVVLLLGLVPRFRQASNSRTSCITLFGQTGAYIQSTNSEPSELRHPDFKKQIVRHLLLPVKFDMVPWFTEFHFTSKDVVHIYGDITTVLSPVSVPWEHIIVHFHVILMNTVHFCAKIPLHIRSESVAMLQKYEGRSSTTLLNARFAVHNVDNIWVTDNFQSCASQNSHKQEIR